MRHRIADLERDETDRLRLLDLWNFQHKEIADAKLQPEEDKKLEAEKRVLANAERVRNAATAAYDALYESDGSAQQRLCDRLHDTSRISCASTSASATPSPSSIRRAYDRRHWCAASRLCGGH